MLLYSASLHRDTLPADHLPKSLATNSAGSRIALIRSHSKDQNTVPGLSGARGEHSGEIILLTLWLDTVLVTKQVSISLSRSQLLLLTLYTFTKASVSLLYTSGVNVRQYTSIHPSHLWSSLCLAAPTE